MMKMKINKSPDMLIIFCFASILVIIHYVFGILLSCKTIKIVDDEIITPESVERIYGDVVISEVISIHDGDTFTVNINDWPPIVGNKILVRVSDIDTPEITDHRKNIKDMSIKAKNFTSNMLKNGKNIELKNIKRDKYFRLNAEVYIDGHSLGEELINKKLAHYYDGGTKKSW